MPSRQVLDNLKLLGNVEYEIVVLNHHQLGICKGCKRCFSGVGGKIVESQLSQRKDRTLAWQLFATPVDALCPEAPVGRMQQLAPCGAMGTAREAVCYSCQLTARVTNEYKFSSQPQVTPLHTVRCC
jgi:hypothetical protein